MPERTTNDGNRPGRNDRGKPSGGRLEKARAHLQREQRRAQRHLQALEQALIDVGLPETLVVEVEWRLRGWDENLPTKLLGALPKRKWVQQLQRRSQDLLVRLRHHVEDKSPATRSRWQWTWVGDDRVFKQWGQPHGLVGTWYSGQEHRVRRGIDGLLLVVVIGEGKLVIPVDFTVRRPDPVGAGRPCYNKLTWLQVMVDRTWAALRRRLPLPSPLVVADRGFGDADLLAHVACQRGMLLVEGKRTYVFQLPDGRRVKGRDLLTQEDWPWHDSAQRPGVRYARLSATSPTYGRVTVVIVEEPGEDRYYLLCLATASPAGESVKA